MSERQKPRRIFHVNMLRKFNESGFVQEDDIPEKYDVIVWESQSVCSTDHLAIGKELSSTQLEEVKSLISKFRKVWSSVPGRTHKIVHSIDTGSAPPILQYVNQYTGYPKFKKQK